MTARQLPSQEYLKQIFDYDPETGLLTWRERPRTHFKNRQAFVATNRRYAGKTAGSPCKTHGYVFVSVDRVRYRAHRVIWKIQTGEEPPEFLDHRDVSRSSNRFHNLRPATKSQNTMNKGANKNSQTGIKGITRHGPTFRFEIGANGGRIRKSGFRTIEEAHAAWLEAARELHKEFMNAG